MTNKTNIIQATDGRTLWDRSCKCGHPIGELGRGQTGAGGWIDPDLSAPGKIYSTCAACGVAVGPFDDKYIEDLGGILNAKDRNSDSDSDSGRGDWPVPA